MIQGDPVSLTIFNIVANSVARKVLLEVCGPQESHQGFGWAAVEQFFFHAENDRIVGRNRIWFQTLLTATVRIFERVGPLKSIGKNKEMVCTPGFMWVQHGTAEYKRRETG